jgi:hypothetical protein
MMMASLLMVVVQAAALPLVTVSKSDSSSVDEPQQVVVRNMDAWNVLWKSHTNAPTVPRVDFTKDMVVAVFLGTRPSAGFSVEILRARRDGGELVIEYAESRPAPGGVAAQLLTAPAHIVTVPRHNGPVRFEKRPEARSK